MNAFIITELNIVTIRDHLAAIKRNSINTPSTEYHFVTIEHILGSLRGA